VAISCRPIALRRAISNLVDNAIKYGTDATVHLAHEPERVVITIDDDGPGIPPSQREKVFEPFYRQERSRNPETGGVGLGLSVARSIIWSTMGISASPIGARVACTSGWTSRVPNSGSSQRQNPQSATCSTELSASLMIAGELRLNW
jgi:K+-sensing histidine kinase KdpD